MGIAASFLCLAIARGDEPQKKDSAPVKPPADAVELKLELPKPIFAGTPKNASA